ncbi:MAG: DUF6476 family protein [Aestuariivita sp.]|uniref:DUF6476 family protein n=1 Tax=Aestuariivita sp. TaxID=1872407 RepID=UPI003BB14C95
MEGPSENLPEPANLRFLRRLVTLLTVVMIGGLVVITSLIVIRFSQTGPALPDQITLPDGTTAETFTKGRGWYGVVTTDNQILIFDQLTGALRQTIEIE